MKVKTLLLLLVFTAAFGLWGAAQVDSTEFGGGAGAWLPVPFATALLALWGVYEIVARYYPTVKNISIISWVVKVLTIAFPNRKAGGGTHEATGKK